MEENMTLGELITDIVNDLIGDDLPEVIEDEEND